MMKDTFTVLSDICGLRAPRFKIPYKVALAAAHIDELISCFTRKEPKAPLAGVKMAAYRMFFDPSYDGPRQSYYSNIIGAEAFMNGEADTIEGIILHTAAPEDPLPVVYDETDNDPYKITLPCRLIIRGSTKENKKALM